MELTLGTCIFILCFGLFTAGALRAGHTIKSSRDFSVAGRALNSTQVSWVIMGAIIGGVSTIGTVQTAYDVGIAAWIFTLGSGLSCLLLGLLFATALRREEVTTVSEFLGHYFGRNFQYYSSIFNSLGMYVHVIAQYLASMAILQSALGMSPLFALATATLLMGLFVVFGGMAGAGVVGKIKFYMLYAIMISAAAIALSRGGGVSGIISALPAESEHLNIFAMGTSRTLLDLAAMVAGVLSTQIYLQAIFSAKSVREARNGALLSAAVIPPIGLLGIIIGLYLKGAYPELAASSAEALPFFFKIAFPEPIAALCAAGLLLVVLGTGSGLILGVSTNIYVDVILKSRNKVTGSLSGVRICALTVLLSSAGIVLLGGTSAILQWSYLSMGLRGSAVFAGLCIAVFLRKIAGAPLVRALLYLLPVIYLLLAIPTTGQ